MTHDPMLPITTSPPRPVHKHMRVAGHDVQKTAVTGGARLHCSCGWRSFGVDDAAEAEGGHHLANAWPEIVARPAGSEGLLPWIAETEAEYLKAEAERVALEPSEGQGVGLLAEGQAMPVTTERYLRLEDRVRCLRHQLEDLNGRHYGAAAPSPGK